MNAIKKNSTEIILTIAMAAIIVVGSAPVVLMWAMSRSMDRAACYRSVSEAESCGSPNFVERKMAHYIAHVDLEKN